MISTYVSLHHNQHPSHDQQRAGLSAGIRTNSLQTLQAGERALDNVLAAETAIVAAWAAPEDLQQVRRSAYRGPEQAQPHQRSKTLVEMTRSERLIFSSVISRWMHLPIVTSALPWPYVSCKAETQQPSVKLGEEH